MSDSVNIRFKIDLIKSIIDIFHSWILDKTEAYCTSLLQNTKKPQQNNSAFNWPKTSEISTVTEFLSRKKHFWLYNLNQI